MQTDLDRSFYKTDSYLDYGLVPSMILVNCLNNIGYKEEMYDDDLSTKKQELHQYNRSHSYEILSAHAMH